MQIRSDKWYTVIGAHGTHNIYIYNITYLPHKAVAEVCNHNEAIGRKVWNSIGSKVNGFHIQLFWTSIDLSN